MLRSFLAVVLGLWGVSSFCQSTAVQSSADAEALLAKTKALYDTPFQRGLGNFSCAIDFDLDQNLRSNFGANAPIDTPIAKLLRPIRYQVFVDHTGPTVTTQPGLPDFSRQPLAARLEQANRMLIQQGFINWMPYAFGSILPTHTTRYRFEKTATGYHLLMNAEGLNGTLLLDRDLHVMSATLDKPQSMEITMRYVPAPDGLVIAESSTDVNHAGVSRFQYTYQLVDGFQLPQHITVTSEPHKMTLAYTLTNCKAQHGPTIVLAPPIKH